MVVHQTKKNNIILILTLVVMKQDQVIFFGPLCVVACYIDERDYDWLASLNVRDPKLMTPQEVIEIAREIKDRLVYSLLFLIILTTTKWQLLVII